MFVQEWLQKISGNEKQGEDKSAHARFRLFEKAWAWQCRQVSISWEGVGQRLSSPGIAHCIHVSIASGSAPSVRSPYGLPNLLIIGGTSFERV